MFRHTFVSLSLGLLAAAAPGPDGASALRWQAAADGAAVVLPVAAKAKGVLGASLFCRAQQWAFLLRVEDARAVPQGAPARITVGEAVFASAAEPGPATLTLPVPARILFLLKNETAMGISVEGTGAASARFSLAGSREAIETAAPRCGPPDMPGFEPVALLAEGDAAAAAGPLLEEEKALFREATGKEPALRAAFVEAEAPRTLLFASLCGSNRYYGETGCKLTGFAAAAGRTGPWTSVYETDGMHLFRDRRTFHDGWPDLATISTTGEEERMGWTWDGAAYRPADDPAVAGEPPAVIDELRTGTTE